jgi:hypothetical protein
MIFQIGVRDGDMVLTPLWVVEQKFTSDTGVHMRTSKSGLAIRVLGRQEREKYMTT